MGKAKNDSRNPCIKKHSKKSDIQTQKWKLTFNMLFKKMQLLGYQPDSDGVCHGISCVALHAVLLKELNQLDRDLFKIRKITNKDIDTLPVARTIFDAVEINQDPGRYPHLFATYQKNKKIIPIQQISTAFSLTMSKELESQGGIVCVEKFSGAYDTKELETFCRCIRISLEKFPHPIAFLMSDDSHIITVTYCTDERAWIKIDARTLPIARFKTDDGIAKAIERSLTPHLSKTIVSTLVISSQQFFSTAKQAVEFFMASQEWRAIHRVQENKKRYFAQWLYISAFDGCLREVKALLEQGVDPNVSHGRDSSLSIAAMQGHYAIVNLLLSYGANVTGSKKVENSPLFLAKKHGHDDVENLLERYGAKL